MGDRSDTLSLFQNYLRAIGRIQLLTAAQERALAERVVQGDRAARDELVTANLRLVVSIAKRHATPRLTLDDLVQEGTIGLIRAAEKFRTSKGAKFSTYATWWVRHAVLRAIETQDRSPRIPVHSHHLSRQIQRVRDSLAQRNGSEPSVDAIARTMRRDPRMITSLLEAMRGSVSLDMPVDRDGRLLFGDTLPDTAAPVDDSIWRAEIARHISAAVDNLPLRYREVIVRFYGLDGEPPEAIRTIATRLGVSRQRADHIRLQALKRLRTSGPINRLACS